MSVPERGTARATNPNPAHSPCQDMEAVVQHELRQQVIETQRSTFTPLINRYGDRPPTRYDEASIDIQPTENFHYRPLWDPQHEIYDETYSAFRLTRSVHVYRSSPVPLHAVRLEPGGPARCVRQDFGLCGRSGTIAETALRLAEADRRGPVAAALLRVGRSVAGVPAERDADSANQSGVADPVERCGRTALFDDRAACEPGTVDSR
jgi:hypothetical protein